jgi:hypothetical protein
MSWNLTQAVAEALKAVGLLKQSTPESSCILSAGESNQFPVFNNAEEAIAFARAKRAEGFEKFVIRVFTNEDKQVYSLPQGETVSGLAGEGIVWDVAFEGGGGAPFQVVTELPETIPPNTLVLFEGELWRGILAGESTLPVGSPIPAKGYWENIYKFIFSSTTEFELSITRENILAPIPISYLFDGLIFSFSDGAWRPAILEPNQFVLTENQANRLFLSIEPSFATDESTILANIGFWGSGNIYVPSISIIENGENLESITSDQLRIMKIVQKIYP